MALSFAMILHEIIASHLYIYCGYYKDYCKHLYYIYSIPHEMLVHRGVNIFHYFMIIY